MTDSLADLNAGRVLIVDDDEAVASVLMAILSRTGFVVNVVNTGADAMRAVVSTKPDVVLLDWMLPDIAGVEVCMQIKSVPSTHHIPVVMITGHSDNAHRQAGLDAGASEFLGKPFLREDLLACVRSLVRLRRNSIGRISGSVQRQDPPMTERL